MNRRTYIAALGTAAVGGIAGCSGADLLEGDGSVTPTDEDGTATPEGTSDVEVQWGATPGPTPSHRRFVAESLGTSEPSVSTEATVDRLLPVPLVANGTAWVSPFTRISLSDGSLSETDIPTDSEDTPRFGGPLGLADAGILANGRVDGDRVTALFDWGLNRQWTTTPPLATPVVGDEVVVGATGVNEEGAESTVTAVAQQSGDVQWETTFDAESRPLFAIAEGTVYATGRVDGEETLLRIDAASGETTTLWTDDTEVDEQFGLSLPVVASGSVYVSRVPALGDEPPGLWAIDANDGSVRWRDSGVAFSPPVVGSDLVLSAGGAYEASDGTVRWTLPEDLRETLSERSYAIQARVATPNEVIVGAGDPTYRGGGLIAALSVEDGSLLWQRSLEVSPVSVRVASEGLVVSGARDADESTGGVLVME